MSFKKIFLLFFAWRIFDFLILFLASRFIPYLGFFPYKEVLASYNLPSWLTSLANFDGVHYLLIAQRGYGQYEQAFFPLYPILIRIITPLFFGNSLIASLFISNFSFLLGLWLLSKYLKLILTNPAGGDQFQLILIILLFPTSFFFGAVYTEGLFFFLMAASLYFLEKKKYFFASFFAFFASLTRLVGIFLIIPFLFHFYRKRQHALNNLTGYLAPILGLFVYSFYLWQTTGDPLFFLTSQPAFGANRSTNLIFLPQVIWRYLKIFSTAFFNFQFFISLFEFFIFHFVFIILIFDFLKNIKLKIIPKNQLISLNLFSFANLLLPTFTGTLSSIPRYALFSLSFFIYLSQIKNQGIKISIIFIFFIFHLISLAFFGQGYFVS